MIVESLLVYTSNGDIWQSGSSHLSLCSTPHHFLNSGILVSASGNWFKTGSEISTVGGRSRIFTFRPRLPAILYFQGSILFRFGPRSVSVPLLLHSRRFMSTGHGLCHVFTPLIRSSCPAVNFDHAYRIASISALPSTMWSLGVQQRPQIVAVTNGKFLKPSTSSAQFTAVLVIASHTDIQGLHFSRDHNGTCRA